MPMLRQGNPAGSFRRETLFSPIDSHGSTAERLNWAHGFTLLDLYSFERIYENSKHMVSKLLKKTYQAKQIISSLNCHFL